MRAVQCKSAGCRAFGREVKMDINISRNEKELTVGPVGRLDSSTSGDFETALKSNFTDEVETLIIDFGEVDFISSKGLRVLISAYKSLGSRKMEIVNANPSVREILRLSGLLKVIEIK